MLVIILHVLGFAYLVFMMVTAARTDYKTPGWEWFWEIPNADSVHPLNRFLYRNEFLALLIIAILMIAGILGISRLLAWSIFNACILNKRFDFHHIMCYNVV